MSMSHPSAGIERAAAIGVDHRPLRRSTGAIRRRSPAPPNEARRRKPWSDADAAKFVGQLRSRIRQLTKAEKSAIRSCALEHGIRAISSARRRMLRTGR